MRKKTIRKNKSIFGGTRMVHKKSDKKPKGKPRGRPFVKGNKFRFPQPTCEILDDTGHESGDKGGFIESIQPIETVDVVPIELPKEDQKILDSISFTFEKNVITILLKSILKPSGGRYFKIQLILNDKIEVKPSSFVTKQSAISFWDLLKGELE